MGIMTGKAAAPLYFNSTIFLFMGGFMIALAMERWQLHRRIALLVIKTIGGGPSRIVLGFMGASAFLSMWISNTATAVMMLPIGLSIILQMEKEFREGDAQFLRRPDAGHRLCRLHGRCRNPGGNPPESGTAAGFRAQLPTGPGISFGLWFIMALPLTLIMVGIIWVTLTKVFFRSPPT